MIPEYRLMRNILKLKSNKLLVKTINKSAKEIIYNKPKLLRRFIFSVNNHNHFFNHILCLDFNLRGNDITSFLPLIVDFNYFIASSLPLFRFQLLYFDDAETITKKLLEHASKNEVILGWYNEAQSQKEPEECAFLFADLDPETTVHFRSLLYVSGKLFEHIEPISEQKEIRYQFGVYLMLFYLLNFETKQTLRFGDTTTWDFKGQYDYDLLFTKKLNVITKLTEIIQQMANKNFNLYLRTINYLLNEFSA